MTWNTITGDFTRRLLRRMDYENLIFERVDEDIELIMVPTR